ncbi:MAG: hypothetical protein ACI83O_000279 [Patescibacteria group bacterium]|jgi:hypothetical protein
MSRNSNLTIMQNFTMKDIPNLDTCVKGALELFSQESLPKINIPKKNLLVVGSGNALDTGKIVFSKYHAHYADESTYKHLLKFYKPDMAILFSASGEKHAPIIAKELKRKKIKTLLFTSNQNASAKKVVNSSLIFPKQKEPYTYNTSTYLAPILARTKESPKELLKHINKIEKLFPKNLSKYTAFYLIIPSQFTEIKDMLQTKFDELFGPLINGRIFTIEQTKHAKTVVSSPKELFISFGEKNTLFGKNRLHIPLPKNANYGAMLITSYLTIGKIQTANSPYFKKNIASYCKEASKIFKQEIKPIVE